MNLTCHKKIDPNHEIATTKKVYNVKTSLNIPNKFARE